VAIAKEPLEVHDSLCRRTHRRVGAALLVPLDRAAGRLTLRDTQLGWPGSSRAEPPVRADRCARSPVAGGVVDSSGARAAQAQCGMRSHGFSAATVALAAVASLSACTSTTPTPGVTSTARTKTAQPTDIANLSSISYCVGTSPEHPRGSIVLVRFMRGSKDLGGGRIQVPMRIGVQVPPGPFTVVAGTTIMMSGSATSGQITAGSSGRGCPL